jgi:hypothetical protein
MKPAKTDLRRSLLNEKVLVAQGKTRMRTTLIVEGISDPTSHMIEPAEFTRLEIDARYQRGRTNEVNDLIHVLKNGGKVYDPVTLCRRKGGETLYIVDGHQRFWAHHDCGLPMPAIIYESTGWEAEALLFQAMNMRRGLTPDIIVKSHQGPGAALLRKVAAEESQLIPRVFAPGVSPRGLAIIALARVAEQRWRGKKTADPINLLPPPAVTTRIGHINWPLFCTSFAMTHIHNVVAEVAKRWPVEQRWMAS